MPNTCTVTGNVKNLLNANVEGATIKVATLTPFFHGTTWISGELASVETNASGNFSVAVIETETVGKKLSFSFEYFDGVSGTRRKVYTVVVPDDASAVLADLVTSESFPATITTFPAANVTVAPITGLTAANVQAALAEHQTEIEAAATSAALTAHIDDTTAAHAASAVSFSPTGSIAATDAQTAIAEVATDAASALSTHEADSTNVHGIADTSALITASSTKTLTNTTLDADGTGNSITNIDNDDIKAAANIERSKLASGTNYRILANDSSGVMSENAALTATHVVVADANGQLAGVAPGAANNILKSDGTDWTSGSAPVANLVFSSQTSGFTANSSVDVYILSGASFTVTLPAAASNSGKVFRFKHNDSTLGRVYTIDGNSSETIDGALTKKVSTQGEELTITCDGSNWHIVNRYIKSEWTDYSPSSTPGLGTVSSENTEWRRVGDSVEIQASFTAGTVTTTEARWALPTGLTSSTSKIPATKLAGTLVSGDGAALSWYVLMEPTVTYVTFSVQGASTNGLTKANGDVAFVTSSVYSFRCVVPIEDWEG